MYGEVKIIFVFPGNYGFLHGNKTDHRDTFLIFYKHQYNNLSNGSNYRKF